MEVLCNNSTSESFKTTSEQASPSITLASVNNKDESMKKIKFSTEHNRISTLKPKKLKADLSTSLTNQNSFIDVMPVTNEKCQETDETREVFCICRRSSDDEEDDDMMIECEVCKDWLHGK
jgi:hypothetical protein